MWYEYDGNNFTCATYAGAVKVRNIDRKPNVAFWITDTSRQIKSLTVLGRAEVAKDNQSAQELRRRLSIRHLGPDEGTDWANSMEDEEMAVIHVIPDKFLWTG